MEQYQSITFKLGDHQFETRPVREEDRELINKGFDRLSDLSRYMRFFSVQKKLSEPQLGFFTHADGIKHVAWGVSKILNGETEPVAIGRFVRTKEDPNIAELAITVVDEYQGIGLGWFLFALMNRLAVKAGIDRFRYYVLATNKPVLTMISRFQGVTRSSNGPFLIVSSQVIISREVIRDIPGAKRLYEAMDQVARLLP